MARLRRHRAAAAPRAHRQLPIPPGVAPLPVDGQPAQAGVACRRGRPRCQDRNDPASRPRAASPKPTSSTRRWPRGITRYLASSSASRRAPSVRRARSAGRLAHPCLLRKSHLSFSGGITQWDAVVEASTGSTTPTVELSHVQRLLPHERPRAALELLLLDEGALRPLPEGKDRPEPQFSYSKAPPAGSTDRCRDHDRRLCTGENVVWKWDASRQAYMRYYQSGGVRTADLDAGGGSCQALNVIIEMVATKRGLTRRAAPSRRREHHGGTGTPTSSATQGRGRHVELQTTGDVTALPFQERAADDSVAG